MQLTVSIAGIYSECIYTKEVIQNSTNVSLFLEDAPESLSARVRISNGRDCGNAVDFLVQENPFTIPDGFFVSGDNVYLQFETADTQQRVVVPVLYAASPDEPAPPIPIPEGGGDIYHHYDEDTESMVIGDGNINVEEGG